MKLARPSRSIPLVAPILFLWMTLGCERPPGTPPTQSRTESNAEVSDRTITDLGPPRENADLSGRCLQDLASRGLVLNRPDLSEVDAVDYSLGRSILSGPDFRDSRWLRGDLSDSVLAGADWQGSLLVDTSFESATLERGRFANTRFLRCGFRRSDLRDCSLEAALFSECDFTCASFENVSLAGASFEDCDFSGADLSGLRDWRQVSDLSGCTFDRAVSPPQGFLEFVTEQRDALTLAEAD